ncbi:MAG: T9SS type A sorting domain-containing protein [Chitinophagales bacterium]|nr:T9SS type A sorting domain-containing protein [Chitinophagales bacterium]MDW8418656.1 T9SS type A sorting domain-containing protein [Chitinophagales bacterium]
MKKTFICITLGAISLLLYAQSSGNTNWYVMRKDLRVFIENKGQFTPPAGNENDVQYAFDGGGEDFLFTRNGLILSFLKTEKKPRTPEEQIARMQRKKEGFKSIDDWREFEKVGLALKETRDVVTVEWVGANPQVTIVPEQKNSFYHSYTFYNKEGKEQNINFIPSYNKLIYRNLYPNIDVVYELTGDCGFKYSIIVKPGGDISKVQLRYSKPASLRQSGEVVVQTLLGPITEHVPVTFYADNPKANIYSRYFLQNNTISFKTGVYDKNKTIIIDPWVQTPNFINTGWDCVWECERDGAGNVYVIGGTSPMQLYKYNAAGALQWTYNTPYDTTEWLGTFAVDNAGNSYVTNGSLARIFKVNTSGTLVWNNPSPGGLFGSTEFWNIAFNCDQTRLVIGGTGGTLPPLPFVYNVDMNSGNVLNSKQVHDGALFPTQEVRAITACGNSKYYFLTHDSIGYIHDNLTSCLGGGGGGGSNFPFHVSNGISFGYKCENWRYNNTGIMAIAYHDGFVYVHRGNQLQKRAFSTGAVVATATIPNGIFTSSMGSNQVGCSGIDIDSCGNIYVGSVNAVYRFNTNLQQTGSFPTSGNYNVYDVEVSTNGDIIACGSTGTSSSGARTGYIQSWSAGSCAIKPIVCCDATICPVPTKCLQDPPVTLTTTTAGGTWSGPGVNSNGVFNPTTAGVGTHTITYTLPCGSESIQITVNACAALNVCNNNGVYQVSGGTGPYTWYEYNPGGTINITNQQQCQACGGTWLLNQCFNPFPIPVTSCNIPPAWVQVGTGNTHTPSNVFPKKVTDNSGGELIINNASSVPPCSSCALGATATSNPATCGQNNGSATVTPTGGTASSYSWSNGGNTATITNLAPGTYTVTVSGGGCTATASVTVINSGTPPALSTSSTAAGCTTNGSATVTITSGSGPFTYNWSNGANTPTINAAAGTYTVTVTGAGGCTASASVNIPTSGNAITLNTSSTSAGCGTANGSATVNVTTGSGPFTYSWSNGGNSATISNLAPGTYTVTVTGSGGCSATASVNVSGGTPLTLVTSSQQTSCTGNTGSATVNVISGTGPFTYNWSNGATTQTINNLAQGTYTVTVTGSGNCTATASVVITAINGVTLSIVITHTTCGNNNGSVTANTSSGTPPFNFLWSNGANTSSISNLAAGTYTVTVTDANNCTATASAAVNPSGGSSVQITTNKPVFCSGDSAKICAPTGYASYLWNTGATTPCIFVKNAGNYKVTVTDNGGCTAVSNSITQTVHPVPPVGITVKGDTLTSSPAVSYQWYFNGSPIPGATGQIYIVTQSGYYQVEITDANGCKNISEPIELSVSGINNIHAGKVVVYPNPLYDGRWILEVSPAWMGAKAEIYDVAGRIVHRFTVQSVQNTIEYNAAQGVYTLRLLQGKKDAAVKLIKY